MRELTNDNLAEVVSENDTVVVQYMASWCGNCRVMKPKFKKLAAENENATFLLVDAESTLNRGNLPRWIIYPLLQPSGTVTWSTRCRLTSLNF